MATEPGRARRRVILVGRTGLDHLLRRDASVELVRVASLLEAVGEISDPIDEDSPAPCTVLVASHAAGADASAFTHAARILDPAVRVLGVGDRPIAGVDATISAGISAAELARAIRGEPSPPETPPAVPLVTPTELPPAPVVVLRPHTPTPGTTPSPSPAAPPASSASFSLAAPGAEENVLIRAILRAEDPVPAAVELIRARLNDRTVRFTPMDATASGGAGAGGSIEPGSRGRRHAVVTWEGRTLGVLESDAAIPEALAPHAAFLAGWIVLRDRFRQLRLGAFTDPLTGAWNRRYFDLFLGEAITRAAATRRSVTLLVFDIDDFKQFNARFGHAAGDEILRETVRLLKSVIRPTDRVCRIGGDEFAVIFDEPEGPRQPASRHPDSVSQIADRFQAQVRARRFPKLGLEAPGALAISGGLATYPWDGRTPEELLARADQLALDSKRQGKNVISLGPSARPDA